MAGSLFDDAGQPDGTFQPCDRRVPAAERLRLSRQCQLIVDKLRQGRTPNMVLAGIALKYGGRISDARKAGFDIRCVEQDHKTGYAVYALFVDGREVGAAFRN